jgi:hypothetical protein
MTELPFEVDERLAKIHQRANSAGVPCVWHGTFGDRPPTLKLKLPDGTSGMVFDINEGNADSFAKVPFEHISVLPKHKGYWNKRDKELVATLHVKNGSRRDLWTLPSVASTLNDVIDSTPGADQFDQLERSLSNIRFTSAPKDGRLTFQRPGSVTKVHLYSPPETNPILGDNTGGVTLQIEGAHPRSVTEAEKLLFDIAHAIFFELDATYAITLQIVGREHFVLPLEEKLKSPPEDVTYLPERRFPPDAIALYMYARAIRGYPVLEYLVLYQVIEHCMLAFSRSDVVENLRSHLENPSFDINDRVALSQLIGAERRGGRGNVSEREQVRLTMQTCVTTDSIREFLMLNKKAADFISTEPRPLGAHAVTAKYAHDRLPNQVADRIYDLRCRIVHAKGDALDQATGPLLATNPEANQLYPDLLLLRFVARQVLISSSMPSAW